MQPHEIQARAVIAAALITSGSVVVPPIPITGTQTPGLDARRLRLLTDHIYEVLTAPSAPRRGARAVSRT